MDIEIVPCEAILNKRLLEFRNLGVEIVPRRNASRVRDIQPLVLKFLSGDIRYVRHFTPLAQKLAGQDFYGSDKLESASKELKRNLEIFITKLHELIRILIPRHSVYMFQELYKKFMHISKHSLQDSQLYPDLNVDCDCDNEEHIDCYNNIVKRIDAYTRLIDRNEFFISKPIGEIINHRIDNTEKENLFRNCFEAYFALSVRCDKFYNLILEESKLKTYANFDQAQRLKYHSRVADILTSGVYSHFVDYLVKYIVDCQNDIGPRYAAVLAKSLSMIGWHGRNGYYFYLRKLAKNEGNWSGPEDYDEITDCLDEGEEIVKNLNDYVDRDHGRILIFSLFKKLHRLTSLMNLYELYRVYHEIIFLGLKKMGYQKAQGEMTNWSPDSDDSDDDSMNISDIAVVDANEVNKIDKEISLLVIEMESRLSTILSNLRK